MSIYVDQKYAGLVSSKLLSFKKKGAYLYNFRCPICGDSKKKNKARGYFYKKQNNLMFKCHNCGATNTFASFLKTQDPALYKTYALERFKNGENGHSNYEKPDISKLFKMPKLGFKPKLGIPSIADLPSDHDAFVIMKTKRLIPEEFLSDLYYAENFSDFVQKIFPNRYPKLKMSEPRIVIPFYDKYKNLIAIQGRAIGQNLPKYITLKAQEDSLKVFGLDRVRLDKMIYVCEGPLDSLFLPNAIAAAGLSLPDYINPENCVFIYDNEPLNKDVVTQMLKIIEKGYKIFIWPKQFLSKDINDVVMNGTDPSFFKSIIDERIYRGLTAKMKLIEWRSK